MTQKKPERTLEMHVDIDAPIEAAWKAITEGPGIANWFAPVAEVSAPGAGATVKAGWSEEMMMTSTVEAWEPLEHVRWLDESGWMGPGTSMAVDYYLSTENGRTRVRLVQSAFGASEGWDDLFDGMETGWTFLDQFIGLRTEGRRQPPTAGPLPGRTARSPRSPVSAGRTRTRRAASETAQPRSLRPDTRVCPPRPLDDVPWPGRTERIVPPRTDVALDGLGEGVSCGGLESIFRNG